MCAFTEQCASETLDALLKQEKKKIDESYIEEKESRFGNSLAYLKAVIKMNDDFYLTAVQKNERLYQSVIPKSVEYLRVEKLLIVKPSILNAKILIGEKLFSLAEKFEKLVPFEYFGKT
ncbi:hypothetical protein MXB_2165 [Myxobolus squamalis]|nr:hypothetical protein MXB_2165 [Myxobolus squamalis]